MAESVDFTKKSISIITGASKGIGQSIAVNLAQRFHPESVIILIARNLPALESTKQSILSIQPKLTVFVKQLDLSQPKFDDYNPLFQEIFGKIGNSFEVAYIFHNAGHHGELRPTVKLSDVTTWRQYYDLNLFSAILLNNAFIAQATPLACRLVVINITSIVGRVPFGSMSMYGSGKAARDMFFRVLALEQPNVTVLNYSPGPVLTDMYNSICDTADVALRELFRDVKETKILTPDQTVIKMLERLEKGDYKNGDVIDYYDRV